jgi:hypothetical protein
LRLLPELLARLISSDAIPYAGKVVRRLERINLYFGIDPLDQSF